MNRRNVFERFRFELIKTDASFVDRLNKFHIVRPNKLLAAVKHASVI